MVMPVPEPGRPSLWRAMEVAGMNAEGSPQDAIAAQILALRDWLDDALDIPCSFYNLLTAESIAAESAEAHPVVKPTALQVTEDQQAAIG
jgi:hypothetical protein